MIDQKRIAELRALADAATPGPWGTVPTVGHAVVAADEDGYWTDVADRVETEDDAEYIATFDPSTVISLLDEIDRLHRPPEAERSYLSLEWERLAKRFKAERDDAVQERDEAVRRRFDAREELEATRRAHSINFAAQVDRIRQLKAERDDADAVALHRQYVIDRVRATVYVFCHGEQAYAEHAHYCTPILRALDGEAT